MFRREMFDVNVPKNIYIHICGTDLIRGSRRELLRPGGQRPCPSGVSYVLENRAVMKRVFPALFSAYRVRAIEDYPYNLLQCLRYVSPSHATDPTVVVLTPGVYNSAYFEHSFLARHMGVELVEGRDLVVENSVRLHAHDRRPAPRGRDLPPGGRRLPRPAVLPARQQCSAWPG
jgi:uncharacterized circularly permuted ATP-grasp superfamily protein